MDLLNQTIIQDPFYRFNEENQIWITNSTWIYSTEFVLTDALNYAQGYTLVFESIDTVASIRFNKKIIGSTINEFTYHTFNLEPEMFEARNVLEI